MSTLDRTPASVANSWIVPLRGLGELHVFASPALALNGAGRDGRAQARSGRTLRTPWPAALSRLGPPPFQDEVSVPVLHRCCTFGSRVTLDVTTDVTRVPLCPEPCPRARQGVVTGALAAPVGARAPITPHRTACQHCRARRKRRGLLRSQDTPQPRPSGSVPRREE